ncbi:glycosyltransferase family 2 protein [Thiobacillus sp.]|uniref:glycosyltransferase family 2 protein n=1 Tax=Thiobacillus sp. TaxID=924 RepID=UPI0025EAD0E6|nr:glycosyltransferase family 2 protein [Thiobacillus sp.]
MGAERTNLSRIDVVMPLYNKRDYIEAAIRSVLAQEGLNELIVVDDGSTDGGAERVEYFARGDARIRMLRQPNAGVSAARNRGVRASAADYVAFLDADDLYLPGFLQQIAALAERYPEAALFGTAYRRFSGDAAQALAANDPGRQIDEDRSVPAFFEEWARGSFFFTSSVCVRRRALLELGTLFPEGERLGEDQDVWFRLAERHPVAASTRVLALYRVDVAGSLTASTELQGLLPCYQRLEARLARGDYPAQHVRGARRMLAVNYLNAARCLLRQGKRREAAELAFTRTAASHPSYWLRVALRFLLPGGAT